MMILRMKTLEGLSIKLWIVFGSYVLTYVEDGVLDEDAKMDVSIEWRISLEMNIFWGR